MGDALRSEGEVLRDQLREYERLRAGRVKQRQVQRWEANGYLGVSVQRMQEIADALGATFVVKVRFEALGRGIGPEDASQQRELGGEVSSASPG